MFGVGCGITVCVMVVDNVILERIGKQNFFLVFGPSKGVVEKLI